MNSDRQLKYADRLDEFENEMKEIIKDARNKTAKALGYKDMDEAIKAKLKEEGLELAEESNKDSNSGHQASTPARVYAVAQECNKEWGELTEDDYRNISDINQLKEIERKLDSFKEKYDERSVALHARDIPNFVMSAVGSKCQWFKSNPGMYKAEDNPELAKVCANLTEMRRKAIDLFRLEGSPEYREQAEKFVREYNVPSPRANFGRSESEESESQRSEADQIKNRILAKRSQYVTLCGEISHLYQSVGEKVVNEFLVETNRTKTTVDGLLNAIYHEKNKSRIDRVYEEIKGDIQEVTKHLVKDPAKRARVLDEYDRLKLTWYEKPPASDYKKNERGQLILGDELKGDTQRLANYLSDPTLSFFTTLNAYYSPPMAIGEMKTEEFVEMMPVFINQIDKNTAGFVMTLAHELGHKIDPGVSKLVGYDLTDRYKDLLACYADPKSIKMQKGQEGEVVADAIAAEILAHQISKLPVEQRRQALVASVANFCYISGTNENQNILSCKGQHPEPSLRISGIFGANPNLRKAVGCEDESSKYKSCGLNLSLSGGAAKSSDSGTSVRSAQ